MNNLSLSGLKTFCNDNNVIKIMFRYIDQDGFETEEECMGDSESDFVKVIMEYNGILVSPEMNRIYMTNSNGVAEYDNVVEARIHRLSSLSYLMTIVCGAGSTHSVERNFVLNCA